MLISWHQNINENNREYHYSKFTSRSLHEYVILNCGSEKPRYMQTAVLGNSHDVFVLPRQHRDHLHNNFLILNGL